MTMTVWTWDADGAAFVRSAPQAGGRLLVADSWLVSGGRMRAVDRHRARFSAACSAALDSAEAAGSSALHSETRDAANDANAALRTALAGGEFWQALLDLVPAEGEWFPRVELLAGEAVSPGHGHARTRARSRDRTRDRSRGPAALCLRLRPAPLRARTAVVWVPPLADPREQAGVKGPDLGLLAGLRQQGSERGAQEVLLADADGHVVEAANSNLLWWEGEVLCVPDSGLGVFAGVTASLVREEAQRQGIAVEPRCARIGEITGHEVWLTNALHGLRRVTGWVGEVRGEGVRSEHLSEHFTAWSRWLEQLARPV